MVDDLIHGAVAFEHAQLDDWILVRTDGTPTYNFCVVVDDVTMGISHVIRGNDHLSNTPKQILCYEALGYAVPAFAHVPMILGADRSRLSKRHGATSVQAFRDAGFLPEALVNYLARLGWSHGDQEVFSRDELVALFDIKDVGASGAVFDLAKLEWLSQHSMKSMRDEELAERVRPFLPPPHRARAGRAAGPDRGRRLKERAKTLKELADKARFYFEDVSWDDLAAVDAKAMAKFFTADGAARLERLHDRLAQLDDFSAGAIEVAVRELAAELGLKLVDLAQLARVAVTGGTASPPIFDVLSILGRDGDLAAPAPGRGRRAGPIDVTLFLARHGQTDWNASRRFQGASDIGLSDRGRAQAEALGRALGGAPAGRRLREPAPAGAGDGGHRARWRHRARDPGGRAARAVARGLGGPDGGRDPERGRRPLPRVAQGAPRFPAPRRRTARPRGRAGARRARPHRGGPWRRGRGAGDRPRRRHQRLRLPPAGLVVQLPLAPARGQLLPDRGQAAPAGVDQRHVAPGPGPGKPAPHAGMTGSPGPVRRAGPPP